MTADASSMSVVFDFTSNSKGIEGRFTSYTQHAMDYPLDAVTVSGPLVHMILGGSIDFEGTHTGDLFSGTFKSPDASGTFSFHRTEKPPLPYSVTDVRFNNGTVTLAGTVVSPKGAGRHPAVVLIQGSGYETRWGTNRYIADRFARAGIVVLIYDKRGCGESSGDWKTADYNDLAHDALSGVDLLRSRGDVSPERVGLHGHSEGGIISAMATVAEPSKVAFVIAEDTVAGPVWEQDVYRVEKSFEKSLSSSDLPEAMKAYKTMINVMRGAQPYSDLESISAADSQKPWFSSLGIPPRDSWIWQWYRKVGNLNTLDYWNKVKVPVFIAYGERDQLEPVDEAIGALTDIFRADGVPYIPLIVPMAEHNLTIHPQPGQPFFWWYGAPGIVDTVAAWIDFNFVTLQAAK